MMVSYTDNIASFPIHYREGIEDAGPGHAQPGPDWLFNPAHPWPVAADLDRGHLLQAGDGRGQPRPSWAAGRPPKAMLQSGVARGTDCTVLGMVLQQL